MRVIFIYIVGVIIVSINYCFITNKIFPFAKFELIFNYDINNSKILFKYHNFYNKVLDFVITDNYLYIGLGHKVLYQNQNVICAGTIVVNSYGYITSLTNKSGHFHPSSKHLLLAYELLKTKFNLCVEYTTLSVVNSSNTFNILLASNKEYIEDNSEEDLTQKLPPFDINIPSNFNWQIYRVKNNLHFLDTQQKCEDHYKTIGFYDRLIISINPEYQYMLNVKPSQKYNMTINEFYAINSVDKQFDEIQYLVNNPQVLDFYQPYCRQNSIDDKHRLFFHYVMYGYQGNENKYIEALTQLFVDLIATNSILKSNLLLNFIKNNIFTIFSTMRDPVQYNVYINRRNNLVNLEKLIPFLPPINIEILPENII